MGKPAVKIALSSSWFLFLLLAPFGVFAGVDDSHPLPERFAEVVLTVEGMT